MLIIREAFLFCKREREKKRCRFGLAAEFEKVSCRLSDKVKKATPDMISVNCRSTVCVRACLCPCSRFLRQTTAQHISMETTSFGGLYVLCRKRVPKYDISALYKMRIPLIGYKMRRIMPSEGRGKHEWDRFGTTGRSFSLSEAALKPADVKPRNRESNCTSAFLSSLDSRTPRREISIAYAMDDAHVILIIPRKGFYEKAAIIVSYASVCHDTLLHRCHS